MAVDFEIIDNNELQFGVGASDELEFGTRDIVEIRQSGDYEDLTNKPSINGVTLIGDKTTEDLHIQAGVTSWNGQTGDVVYTPPEVPVQSVNGKTGAVVLDAEDVGALPDDTVIPSKTSQLTNDSGFITGIDSSDVTSALGYTPYDATNPNGYVNATQARNAAPVQSVNGKTGAVVLNASDVGALPSTTTIPTKTSDLTNDSGFVNASQAASAAPVQSVNGATGAVTVQPTLVSGTNIKTINGQSVLGSGDITISTANALYVEITDDGAGNYSSQETYDEIVEAISAGRAVYVLYDARVYTYNGDDGEGEPYYFVTHLINEDTAESLEFTLAKEGNATTWSLWTADYVPPVTSVNGKTGAVSLNASDVGALPDDTPIPVDSDLVHKTGAETITGNKTFTNGVEISRATSGAILKLSSSAADTNFILERTGGSQCVLESGSSVGLFGTKTNHPLQIRTNYTNRMTLGTDGSVVLATAPAASSNNNQVATTKWVNDKGYANASDIPNKTSDLTNDSGFITSAQAPVQSVNGQTGVVSLAIPTKTSDLTNDSGFITSAPVTSVNSQTGAVVLSASDVDALPSNTPIHNVPSGGTSGQVLTKSSNSDYALTWSTPSDSVQSVNGQTGAVVLDAEDVGALSDSTEIPTKTSDLTNDSGFINTAIFYGTCATAAATTTKEVVCEDFTQDDLKAGAAILVRFSTTNTGAVANLQLDVNGTGAKKIQYINNGTLGNLGNAGYLKGSTAYLFVYDGTYWLAQFNYNSNTTYAAMTTAEMQTGTSGTARTITAAVLKAAVGYHAPVKTTTVTQIQTTGTEIAQVEINGTSTSIYAPSGGGAVDSVNGQTGTVVLDAQDVGALPDTTVIPTKTSDLTNDSGFLINVAWGDVTGKPTFATVATSGSYNDLSNKPTIPAAQVNSDWNANSGVAQILNKPSIPSKTSDLTNDSGFVTSSGVTQVALGTSAEDFNLPMTATGVATLDIGDGLSVSDSSGVELMHATGAGWKHIPSGGAAGQFLGYSSSGTATWQTPPTPTVPTNVSAFTNDAGYLTLATLPIYDGTVQ